MAAKKKEPVREELNLQDEFTKLRNHITQSHSVSLRFVVAYVALALAVVGIGIGTYAVYSMPAPAHPAKVDQKILMDRATAETTFIMDQAVKGNWLNVCGEFSAEFLVRNNITSRSVCARQLGVAWGSLKGGTYHIGTPQILDNEATVKVDIHNKTQTGSITLTLQEEDNSSGKYDVIAVA